MLNKYLATKEKAERRVKWAQGQLDDAQAALVTESLPHAVLVSACAAIMHAASTGEPLTHETAIGKSFMPLTGSGLSFTLADAMEREYVGRAKDGSIYWRDAGLSEECPMVLLGKRFKGFK